MSKILKIVFKLSQLKTQQFLEINSTIQPQTPLHLYECLYLLFKIKQAVQLVAFAAQTNLWQRIITTLLT